MTATKTEHGSWKDCDELKIVDFSLSVTDQPLPGLEFRSIDRIDPHPKLVMFDLDDTLIRGHVRKEGSGPFEEVQPFDTVAPLPGRIEKVNALLDADVKVAVCTNKAGVAFGHQTHKDCFRKRVLFEDYFGITREDVQAGRWAWYEAYGHEEATNLEFKFDDPDRKPRPGMLLRAMADLGEEPSTSLFVGDRPTDRDAAERAGVSFKRADFYFGDAREQR